MENEDKEFETFLGQFELRQHRGFPLEAPVKASRAKNRWVWAAAAVIIASLVSIPLLRYFSEAGTPNAIIEARGDSSYKVGEAIAAGKPIRSGGFEPLTLRLRDETRVEMRAGSEVLIDTKNDGLRVRLNSGSILVSAVKQGDGHLYVETDDTVVSVVGTVFLVERTPLGTRVGVCEGEVEVRQGEFLRKLIPGQQASTNPSMEGPLDEAIAWSSSASRFTALLQPTAVAQQSGPAVPTDKEQKETPKELPAPPKEEPKAEKPPAPPAPEPPRKKVPREEEVAPTTHPGPDAGAESPGKDILNRACSTCHVVGAVENTRYNNKEAYASLVAKQRQMGAGLTDAEAQVLVDYLFNTYGVTQRLR